MGVEVTPIESRPLAGRLLRRLRDVAQENGIPAAQVTAGAAEEKAHPLRAQFDLQIEWKVDTAIRPGEVAPPGSRAVADRATLGRAMAEQAASSAAAPATARRLLAPLVATPGVALAAWKDGATEEVPAARFHCHEVCGNCRGARGFPCSCGNGREHCYNPVSYTHLTLPTKRIV